MKCRKTGTSLIDIYSPKQECEVLEQEKVTVQKLEPAVEYPTALKRPKGAIDEYIVLPEGY